jgi:hypothetical protein
VDLVDVAILLLRIALVAVLYLFLWVVVRGALRGLSTPREMQAVRPAEPAPLVLTVLEPGESRLESGARIGVRSAPTVIGRATSADVVVADAAVSAQHARLDWTDGAWVVRDLDSTNGTRLNARAVRGPTRLRPGDTLEVGPVRFAVSDT